MSYSHTSWSTKEEGGQGQYADAPEAVGFPQAPHFRRVPERGMVRQASSSPTSSLSGAMGDAHITNSHLGGSVPSGMAWSIPQGAYGQLADDSSMSAFGPAPPTPASAGPSGQFSLYSYQTPYNTPSYSPNPDPYPHHSSALPSPTSFAEQFAMQQARADVMAHAHQGLSTPGPATPTSAGAMAGSMSMAPSPIPGAVPMGRDPRRSSSEEIRRLHQRIAELEADRDTVVQRAHQLSKSWRVVWAGWRARSPRDPPSLSHAHPTHPSALEEEWRARTEARRKIFCGVNRAGNALCAWHDSRRERRAYPPRNAPPGMLNCGCTYEQALFEESLSYHGVGSYHPGESVRMDPALRNPLLKLLEERYNYRDGDFDFDPVTRTWRNGEGAAYWEQRLASGAANTRRARGDDRR
ncbi:uncharacterized protein B0H18DRAFT_1115265 [Fomitopsis serialis]|uniref:uncharacterized protein n=1 Tax=Fomitopsis serialis TaxID=139415 RepID=UPI002007385E|nr:uncharacterized protein B0H18DRAFT_1115265 [Neoantrodia serialis]KAH9933910.1 hypothetical protein B0H18DRAFT_1115265 [Neoantrodia serialis]